MGKAHKHREDVIHELLYLRKALKKANLILAHYGIPAIPIGWGTSFADKKSTKKGK
jgi:hypothetical protein